MSKLVVGILPKIELFATDDPYLDKYSFVNYYSKRVIESDNIPVGLLMNDGNVSNDQLELCDVFIIPGGNRIDPVVYKILQYAYENNKPVLGVCMGMQAMAIFSHIHDMGVTPFDPEAYREAYETMKSTQPVLTRLPEDNIHFHEVTRDDYDFARHNVNLSEDSLLSELYENTKKDGVSLHGVVTTHVGSLLNIVGYSDDNVIEAVENKDLLWVGVQFHPEIDPNDKLIANYLKAVENRRDKKEGKTI